MPTPFPRLRSLWRGMRRPDHLEAEMDEEMRFHMEMEAERLMREMKMEPEEARRRAAIAFGGMERFKEEGRDVRGVTRLTGMGLDLRLGARMLVKHPGLTLVAGLALSVAIGGGAGYLEFVNERFHPALPLEDGDRIVGLYHQDAASGNAAHPSLHDFARWREELQSIRELGAFRPLERNLITEDGRSEPVLHGVEISASAFRLTRTPPLLGRPLVAEDEQLEAAPVVVLGHDLWRTRFGGDPTVVGRSVRIGGLAHTVVGVMPEGFAFPVNHDLWTPLRIDPVAYPRGQAPGVRVFGRLAPGASLEEAQAELATVGLRAAADFPASNEHLRPRVKAYVQALVHADKDGPAQMVILYSLNLFFLTLLGVCGANVATLVFARTATREGEITVRTALGASRGRIIAQLFAEALVLASAAALVGLALAYLALRWMTRTAVAAGARLPFWWSDGLAPATLLYAGLLTLLVALIVGVVPGLRATGPHLQARLRHAAAGGSSIKFGRLWTGVIVSQVALTVVFLLIVVSVGWNVHVGRYGVPETAFPDEQFLSVRLEMDQESSPSSSGEAPQARHASRLDAAYQELERRLAAEPGVVATTYASRLPGMNHPGLAIQVEGGAASAGAEGVRWVRSASVAPDFFETFDAPIVAGRGFHPTDLAPDRAVALVDQTFAREVLRGRDPIGLRVRSVDPGDPQAEPGPWYEIVGVARDLTLGGEKSSEDAMLYRPTAPGGAHPIHMALRVRGDPASLAPRLRGAAAAIDPDLRLYDLLPMDEIGRSDRVALGMFLRLLAGVGAIALLLSTAGVYSLMAFTVARRTREIGIRVALGAAPGRIVTSILSRSFTQVGLGVLAGSVPGSMLVAWGAPEVAQGAGLGMGIAAFLAIAALMLTVGTLASAVPAGRALRIHPTEALRAE